MTCAEGLIYSFNLSGSSDIILQKKICDNFTLKRFTIVRDLSIKPFLIALDT